MARIGFAALADLDQQVRPLVSSGEQTLPVDDALSGLLPAGLPRGVTMSVSGDAARSFALALAVGASRAGSWLAMVGLPGVGWAAVAELGVITSRVVAVDIGFIDPTRTAEAVAVAIDGFDVVLIGEDARVGGSAERRLSARARTRGSVLIGVSEPWRHGQWVSSTHGSTSTGAFSGGADVRAVTTSDDWERSGEGVSRLMGRTVDVAMEGKRLPGRRRRTRIRLPDAAGHLAELPLVVSRVASSPKLSPIEPHTGRWAGSA